MMEWAPGDDPHWSHFRINFSWLDLGLVFDRHSVGSHFLYSFGHPRVDDQSRPRANTKLSS